MEIIRKTMERVRPAFEEKGRLAKLKPVYEALDHILFMAPRTTANAPFGRDPLDVKRYMSLVIVALLPCFAASLYFFGWRVLFMVIVSYAAGAIVEILFAVIRKEEVNEGFLVTGLIFPLILPPGTPLWMVALGIMFGILVGKEVFGGTGRNLFNPALGGRVFLALGYPSIMTSTWVEPAAGGAGALASAFSFGVPDAVTSATPLVLAKGGVLAEPIRLFLGHVTGSAGETSALAVLLGGLFLLATGIANWRTVVAVLISVSGLTAILRVAAPAETAPLWFQLLSGGLLFGTFFMATDPVTSPVTLRGKWAYGIIIGAATVLIRTFSGFVEGMMFAVLLGNICAPLIDEVVIRSRMRRYARDK
jgi:Na+-transporting NADH:ubiquinone oxidoreductase subunit B/electron transport complex protein RnfD